MSACKLLGIDVTALSDEDRETMVWDLPERRVPIADREPA